MNRQAQCSQPKISDSFTAARTQAECMQKVCKFFPYC